MELFSMYLGEVFSFLNLSHDGSFIVWMVTIIFLTNLYLLFKNKREIIPGLIKISLSLSIIGMLYGFYLTYFSVGSPAVVMVEKAHTMGWGYGMAALSLTYHFFYKLVLDALLIIIPKKD